jgi:diguanylate cyclase (GGDEF)-like protein
VRVDGAVLEQDLAAESDLYACAAVCCRHVVDAGYELISIYFERSGLLRCYASLGYWQVHDGFPLVRGVIGATVRTGQRHVLDTVGNSTYIEAAPEVVAEICSPVVLDGRARGAVNLESATPLDDEAIADIDAVAEVLARRVAELSDQLDLTGWRLVADFASRVVRLNDPAEVAHETLAVARELTGVSTVAIALGSVVDGYALSFVTGALTDELRALNHSCLTRMGRWMEGARSTYTVGQPDGTGFTGEDSLRAGGVETLGVFALEMADARLGYLMLVDDVPEVPTHDVVEQVELIANLAAAALANAHHVAALTEQSRRDPLTGLGHGRTFSERLRDVQRGPAALHAVLSIDVDHFKDINDTQGHAAGDRVLRALAQSMSATLRGDDCVFRTGGDEFAAIVAVADEAEAVFVAQRLRLAAHYVGVDVSIGVALTSPGSTSDDDESVFTRADAALYHVKRSGRGNVHLSCAHRTASLDA